jgi:hypothetical protein
MPFVVFDFCLLVIYALSHIGRYSVFPPVGPFAFKKTLGDKVAHCVLKAVKEAIGIGHLLRAVSQIP